MGFEHDLDSNLAAEVFVAAPQHRPHAAASNLASEGVTMGGERYRGMGSGIGRSRVGIAVRRGQSELGHRCVCRERFQGAVAEARGYIILRQIWYGIHGIYPI